MRILHDLSCRAKTRQNQRRHTTVRLGGTMASAADFAFDQPLLSSARHFATADYHAARRYVERTTQGLFDLSLASANEFRQYDVRSARLGESLFSLVKVDSVSGYDIEMMDDP